MAGALGRATFLPYVDDIVGQVHPGLTLAVEGVDFVCTKVQLVLYLLLEEMIKGAPPGSRVQADARRVEAAVRITLPRSMTEWALREGQQAQKLFEASTRPEDQRFSSAGLKFPIREVRSVASKVLDISDAMVVLVTGVIEYVCADLLQAAGNRAVNFARSTEITLDDVVHAIEEDSELSGLFLLVNPLSSGTLMANRRQPNSRGSGTSVDIRAYSSPMTTRRSLSLAAQAMHDGTLGRRSSPADPAELPTIVVNTALATARASITPSTGEEEERRLLQAVTARNSRSEATMLGVRLPDGSTTRVEVPNSMLVSELLRFVIYKRHLRFDEYVARIPPADPTSNLYDEPELPGNATVGEAIPGRQVAIGPKEQRVRRGDAELAIPNRCLYVSENGVDVLVMEVFQQQRAIVCAGTIEKLIERLADENPQDPSYVDCMILNYRFFMDALQFFEQLYLRFNLQAPTDPSPEALKYFSTNLRPIQKKVLGTIQAWVDNYWIDFSLNVDLLDYLMQLLEELSTEPVFQAEYSRLSSSTYCQLDTFRNQGTIPLAVPPSTSQFMSHDARLLATQLTLWDLELFKVIGPAEFMHNMLYQDPSTYPNLHAFIRRFDSETFWAATEICSEPSLRQRVFIIEAFVRIARVCREMNNYFSLFAIVGGLNTAPVKKLKKTWAEVSSKTMDTLKEMEELMSPYQNMKNYREKIAAATPPIVPVLPVYLKDLLFTHDGNKTFIHKLVNFSKLRMMSTQVRQILSLRSGSYQRDPSTPNAARIEAAMAYIRNPPIIHSIPDLIAHSAAYEA